MIDRHCEGKEVFKNKIRVLVGEIKAKPNNAGELVEFLREKYELDIIENGNDGHGWPQEIVIKIYDSKRWRA